jgi:hypothetical protein
MMRLLLLLPVVCCFASCSAVFEREWRQALAAGPQAGVEGAWEGTWRSDVNGHHGKLRCVVAPGAGDGAHSFHYHATWADTLSGSYRAAHRVKRTARGTYAFEGSHRLPGWAGGRYHYRGTVRGDDFEAGYRCAKDHGVYRMRRVR